MNKATELAERFVQKPRQHVWDPRTFQREFFPSVTFYKEQWEIIYSVCNDDKTFVPAGNMLGKDFVAAFIVIWYFMSRHPCKIVTTSVKDRHLEVLWGEIDKFVRICKYPLEESKGGPLRINNNGMTKVIDKHEYEDCYVMRMVANEKSSASFQGHHATPDPGQPIDDIPRNLFLGDEASGLPNFYYDMALTWAKRMLIFGNTWPCENFFKWAVKGRPGTKDTGGDILAPCGTYYLRKVIQIKAQDSPNVRYGKALVKKHGKKVMERRDFLKMSVILPGVLTFQAFLDRRENWNEVIQCVSLDAEFYEGPEEKMFPPVWLDESARVAEGLHAKRIARAMGIDTAEGGDNTVWTIVDELGIIYQLSMKTPDTSVITGQTIALINQYKLKPRDVLFDAGGGGQQHVDRLRSQGYKVRAIAFGGTASPEKKRGLRRLEQTVKDDEIKYVYKNRRAEMYGVLRLRLDPNNGPCFAIPGKYVELRRQLAPIPLQWDDEGRMWLPPKRNTDPNSKKVTLIQLLGCSPDEADSTVLAVFGMVDRKNVATAGALW